MCNIEDVFVYCIILTFSYISQISKCISHAFDVCVCMYAHAPASFSPKICHYTVEHLEVDDLHSELVSH